MIEQVRIKGISGTKNTLTIRITPITVLIGANGAGKSEILEEIARSGSNRGEGEVRFQYCKGWWIPEVFRRRVLQPEHRRMLAEKHLVEDLGAGEREGDEQLTGWEVVSVVRSLSPTERVALSEELGGLIPGLAGIGFEVKVADGGSTQRLDFCLRDGSSRKKKNEHEDVPIVLPDGVLFLFVLLVLRYRLPLGWRTTEGILCVEEPERGLHPYLMGEVMNLLREISAAGTQLVLTTYSPHLLDCVRPEEVRVVERDGESGEVRVRELPVGTPEWEEAWEEYGGSLGDMWLAGGLGGVTGGSR